MAGRAGRKGGESSEGELGGGRASLYERPVNLDAAKKAHTEFRRVMRDAGVRVLTVRDILSYAVEDHMGARVELEDLAMRALTYCLAPGFKLLDIAEPVRPLVLPNTLVLQVTLVLP